MDSEFQYLTATDISDIHDYLIAADPESDPGVRAPGEIQSALHYVSEGYFGQVPETIHEKAAHLMRLLSAGHPFVDGNKRTALATADAFYVANGYVFDYDDRVRSILKAFGTDESAVDMERVLEFIAQTCEPFEPPCERDRTELRETIRTTEVDEERNRAFCRLADIGRERHKNIYDKLARE